MANNGGAINTYNNADVSMSNVNFHDNYANWGGSAIYQGKLILSGNIVLGKDDTGNGVYDANIVIFQPAGGFLRNLHWNTQFKNDHCNGGGRLYHYASGFAKISLEICFA